MSFTPLILYKTIFKMSYRGNRIYNLRLLIYLGYTMIYNLQIVYNFRHRRQFFSKFLLRDLMTVCRNRSFPSYT